MSTNASALPTPQEQGSGVSPEQAVPSTLDKAAAGEITQLGPQLPGKGDPFIETSFALGWHMSDLRRLQADGQVQERLNDPLPPIGQLSASQKFDLLISQINVSIKALNLGESASTAGIKGAASRPLLGEVPIQSVQAFLGDQAQSALRDLHITVLTRLATRQYKLGKAYSVGVDLSESMLGAYKACRNTADPGKELAATFATDRVNRIIQEIRDLKTSFQPHAADAVVATLDDFGKWVRSVVPNSTGKTTATLPATWPNVADFYLYPQILAWRGLLSGEKTSTDVLHVGDYVYALKRLVSRYWVLVQAFVFRWTALIIAVPLLLLAGIGLYLLFEKQFGAAYAAVAAFLGVSGISGATITAAVKNALQKTEDDLWDAELGTAVAVAIDHVPVQVPNSHVQALINTRTTQSRGGRTRH
jgi:hypothetical protein